MAATILAEEPKEADELFSNLKPALLSLFPDARLSSTHMLGNYNITDKTTYHRVDYILTRVAEPVSERNLEGYDKQLDEFFLWLKYWDALHGADVNMYGRVFPSEKYAKELAPHRIPRMRYSISSRYCMYVSLEIEFIQRDDNTLILSCSLLLSIPETPDTDVVIENVRVIQKGLQDDRHIYEITFDLKNDSDQGLDIVTGGLSRSASYADGYSDVTLYLRSYKIGDRIHPSEEELNIVHLKPGESTSLTQQESFTKEIKALSLCYMPTDISDNKLSHWIGKVKTKLIQVEPVN